MSTVSPLSNQPRAVHPEEPDYADACHMKGRDFPSHALYAGYSFEWTWQSLGIVLDTCVGTVDTIKQLDLVARGEWPEYGIVPKVKGGGSGRDML